MKILSNSNFNNYIKFSGQAYYTKGSKKAIGDHCYDCRNADYCSGAIYALEQYVDARDDGDTLEINCKNAKDGSQLSYVFSYKDDNGRQFKKYGCCSEKFYPGTTDPEYLSRTDLDHEHYTYCKKYASNQFTNDIAEVHGLINGDETDSVFEAMPLLPEGTSAEKTGLLGKIKKFFI